VVAAGYNSYHEVLMAALPSVLVPNLATTTDDQAARADHAQRAGWGVSVREVTPTAAQAALRTVGDPVRAGAARAAAQAAYPANGAGEAMALVEQLIGLGVPR